ncbi:MAG: hypothetical protein ABSB38_06110 [Dehalococcoidia bacterium]
MALQLTPRPNGILDLDNDTKLKQVKVLVCTETCTFNGYAYCGNHQRLLDTLNQSAVANSVALGKEFLPLVQVEVSLPNGEKKITAETYIKKSSILFVGEKSEGKPAMSETKGRPIIYPMRPKTPMAAEIHMPLYILRGQMHAEAWQQILDIVDRADKFIALTNVEVYRTLDHATSTLDFVAVNRDKIIYVGEPSSSTEVPFPAKDPAVTLGNLS